VWVNDPTAPPLTTIKSVIEKLMAAVLNAQHAIRDCPIAILCDVDLASLTLVVQDVVRLTDATPEARRAGVRDRLGQARTALASAGQALARADRVAADQRAALRREAVSRLQSAERVLREAGDRLR
jgi:hypothetical protein